MGRLIARRWLQRAVGKYFHWRTLRSWLLPAVIAAALIFGLHPGVKADPAPTTDELTAYLANHSLAIGSEVVNGYQQIYYEYQGRHVFITSTAYNHTYATASGPYVTWEGVFGDGGQVYLYNVLTKAEVRLSDRGTNSQPAIYNNNVVWRVWDGHIWQINYYDGMTVHRLTASQYSTVRPSINGQKIIYAEQLAVNDWQAQAYDIATAQTTTLRRGDEVSTAYPLFDQAGAITTAFSAY